MNNISVSIIGLVVFGLSVVLSMSIGGYFDGGYAQNSYFSAISIAVNILTAVVAICTGLILNTLYEIREQLKNNK